jgi:conjugal transfer pilin signal peptidase TrbI
MDANILELQEKIRIAQFRKKLVRWLCVLGAFILSCYAVTPFYSIGFNITHSLDGYMYLIEKGTSPLKDGVYAFNPPKNPYQNQHYFVKYVKGIPGDVVSWEGNDFFINGQKMGAYKPVSKEGMPLTKGFSGVIPYGYYFVWTPHVDSFDSRYGEIGLIHEKAFIGSAERIF